MSYKSNRSWTLPDYNATTNAIIGIAPPTSGITVTWKYPVVDFSDVTINTVSYCYKCNNVSSGWQTLSSGCQCSITGVYCAGYRICGNGAFPTGGGMGICAYDYNNSITISATGGGGGPGDPFTVSLTSINWGSDYCFDGCSS
jgi:hypothetical protein